MCSFNTAIASTSSSNVDEAPEFSNETRISASINDSFPIDISREGEEKIHQNFHGVKFPKQSNGRSFQAQWTDKYDWIEYSKAKDKVFCYACRQFGIGKSNDIFTTSGFDNWKKALTSGHGFHKHELSTFHLNSMLSWKDSQSRKNANQQISTLLNETVLEKRRKYFKAILGTILFLVKNELPLRGDWDQEENKELGLFSSLFAYTLEKDENLQTCQESMPLNARYTCPAIQNEIIHIIAGTLRKAIVEELNESSYLTVMADGTTDRNGVEMVSLAFRYVKNGDSMETLVSIDPANDISAFGLSRIIINKNDTLHIVDEKIISQCYDGAYVMSGRHGGVQKLLERHYNRTIPYVHCLNHKLHLVVEAIVEKIDVCRLFFGQVRLLHNFFGRFKVRREYAGTNIPKLIETRWSGHLSAVQSIKKNYLEILSTLEKIKDGHANNFLPEDMALATGLFNSIWNRNFVFMLHFLNDFLNTLEPANKILQKRNIGFRQAMPVIEAVIRSLKHLRSEENFDRFIQSSDEVLSSIEYENVPRVKRTRQRSTRLNDSIVMESLGEGQDDGEYQQLQSAYYEVIDYTLIEMEKRFNDNSEILMAISELNNLTSKTFDLKTLTPLKSIGLTLPSESELNVVKTYLLEEIKKPENVNATTLKILFPVKDAFPDTYRLLEAGDTFGSSTAINECSFSALNRIDTVKRMSMSDKRLCDLSFLAFEKKKLSQISEDDIIRQFSEKNRKIQLF